MFFYFCQKSICHPLLLSSQCNFSFFIHVLQDMFSPTKCVAVEAPLRFFIIDCEADSNIQRICIVDIEEFMIQHPEGLILTCNFILHSFFSIFFTRSTLYPTPYWQYSSIVDIEEFVIHHPEGLILICNFILHSFQYFLLGPLHTQHHIGKLRL